MRSGSSSEQCYLNRADLPVRTPAKVEDQAHRWTRTFEHLPRDKQRAVLESARSAFAARGFVNASVSGIAEDAEVSVGAIYKYFRTKDDLFLAVAGEMVHEISLAIDAVLEHEESFSARVRGLLAAACDGSVTAHELMQIYAACTTEALAPLAGQLSERIEHVAAGRYARVFAEGKARGEVAPDVDPEWGSLLLDNTLMAAQLASGLFYYRERTRAFLAEAGDDSRTTDMVEALTDQVLRAFASQSGGSVGPPGVP